MQSRQDKMELNITKEDKNPLFPRKEIQGTVKADSIPSKIEVMKALSEKYNVPVKAIRVLDIQGKFGVKEFALRANVYETPEERDKLEVMSKKEKETEAKALEVKEEKPVEETPKEEPKEAALPEAAPEAPAEEVKE